MAVPDKLTARYLRKYGFTAPVIIDVGVSKGTPFLYEAYADRDFILIDPLEESQAAIVDAYPELSATFHVTGLGAKEGRMNLALDPKRPALASANQREGQVALAETREVPIQTLDQLTAGQEGPFGLKIDTEGHELEVLKGAKETLKRCEFVIAEVSIKRRFEGGYRFSDVIAEMAKNGFEVHSFLSGLTRAPRMADVLFIPADSPRFSMT